MPAVEQVGIEPFRFDKLDVRTKQSGARHPTNWAPWYDSGVVVWNVWQTILAELATCCRGKEGIRRG